MNFLLGSIRLLFARVKGRFLQLSSFVRVFFLRLQGVEVSWAAHVKWSAEISCMGGEITIAEGCFIDKGVVLRAYGGKISIGKNCSVNPYCVLYGHGGLFIGNGVRIATHSVFIPSNHNFSDPDLFIYEQGETMKGIRVEDDVWFGAGVRVLDGVIVGQGSVVGAGTVVNRTLPPYGVYVGVPAKKISERGVA